MINNTFEQQSVANLSSNIIKSLRKTSLIISIDEASQILRVHKNKINELISIGAIKAIKSQKAVRIQRKSVDDFIDMLYSPDYPENFKDKRIRDIFEPLHNFKQKGDL